MTANKVDIIKNSFVEVYSRDEVRGNVKLTCQILNLQRGTYYKWLQEDAEFKEKINQADMDMCDDMESVLINRAVDKSDTALIYWMKYNHPKYKETPQFMQQINISKGNAISFVDFSNATIS